MKESGRTKDENGIDLTLIRWMLSLSPLERLEALQLAIGSLIRLQEFARDMRRQPGD